MRDLSLVPLEALTAELEKRFDVGVVILYRDRSKALGQISSILWGDRFTVIGLLRGMLRDTETDIVPYFLSKNPTGAEP